MSDNEYSNAQLASEWDYKFKEAYIKKGEVTSKWLDYIDAYRGDYFKNKNLPDYKSNLVSNYIFAIVETVRPIMLDNNPKFQSIPRQPEGRAFSSDVNEALSYEWDREDMTVKTCRELINTLVIGNSVFFIPWDGDKKNVNGRPISAFNLFPDPLATCVEDAEHLIYADYFHENILKKRFPKYADKLVGSTIKYGELVNNNNENVRIDNQILLFEIWCRDYSTIEEVDGEVTKIKYKYPKGRVLSIAPDLGLVLDDKPAPYQDEEFPFIIIKDYDVPGQFWGEGEVSQLLSPQKHMNDLNNAILDNAKTTANMPWIIDKNSGIGIGKITARPGLVLRKNPGTEVRREQPPSLPAYIVNAVETYKNDIEQISGIYDTLKGDSATGVYTAQGILALQEAGQVRIRLKVKLLEIALGKMANMWFSRMKQYWKEDRWITITHPDGSYDMKKFTKSALQYDYDIKITAGSTMAANRGAMLDLMIRLAQTPMPDGQPIVDREAVAEFLPEEVKSTMLRRMGDKQEAVNQQIQMLQQGIDQVAQQMQQFVQENQQNDEQTMSVVEQMTGAIEQINKKILQLQQEHDRINEEKENEAKVSKIKTDSYNTGYGDAEKLYKQDNSSTASEDFSISEEGDFEDDNRLPDEILTGLESMSDDELQILMAQNPDLMDLIK